ncbi:MAG: glutamyl-tRNA reductase [Actinomycetes bacterium]
MLLCVTANHRNTPFEVLERLAVDAEALTGAVRGSDPAVRGAITVATCNRLEVYLDVDAPADATPEDAHAIARDSVSRALRSLSADAPHEVSATAEVLDSPAAVHHLFAVSAGLESVAVGEEEIAGQVRRAAQAARASGASTGRLDRVFQEAIRTARAARAQGDASRTGRSLARLALDLVGSRLADWSSARVVLVGTGRYAATTVAALRDRGAESITVYSPSGRAQVFGTRHGLDWTNDLRAAMSGADVVITCTTRLSLSAADVPAEAPAYVVDLGLPRNVDAAVGEIEGVTLLDLETIRLHAPLVHWSAEEEARSVVAESAHAFVTAAAVEPSIVALRQHVLELVDDEIERARRRGDADGRVEEALRHLTSVFLHTPSTLARRHAVAGRGVDVAAAIETLFGIPVARPATAAGSLASPVAPTVAAPVTAPSEHDELGSAASA